MNFWFFARSNVIYNLKEVNRVIYDGASAFLFDLEFVFFSYLMLIYFHIFLISIIGVIIK
jgi:hypothetical protein